MWTFVKQCSKCNMQAITVNPSINECPSNRSNSLLFLCAQFAGAGETDSSGHGEHSGAPADVKPLSYFIPATHSRVSVSRRSCRAIFSIPLHLPDKPPNHHYLTLSRDRKGQRIPEWCWRRTRTLRSLCTHLLMEKEEIKYSLITEKAAGELPRQRFKV